MNLNLIYHLILLRVLISVNVNKKHLLGKLLGQVDDVLIMTFDDKQPLVYLNRHI
jgi:hypothetical protein